MATGREHDVARARSPAPPTTRSALLRFGLGSVVALAVALVGGYFALRAVAVDEAKRATKTKALEAATLVESALADGLLSGDQAAVAAVDDLVVSRVLSDSVVRVKIWSTDGRILYADDPAQIGLRYALDEHQLRLFREGGAEVDVSNLDRPENALDRQEGELIEAYAPIRTPSGTPVLFELYERLDSVQSSAQRLLRALALPILAAVALIVAAQAPLVWSLTKRLQRGYEERESLLASAIEASNRERRRIASYLHDGAVQDVAGAAFRLAPLADRSTARGDAEEAAELHAVIGGLRGNVRDLRALLVDLHPPNLAAEGIEAAISDLVGPLEARGVAVSVSVDGAERLGRSAQTIVYRVAQEAVRNVIAYAFARSVRIELSANGAMARLLVVDDGRGFTPEGRATAGEGGHLGLSLLEGLARDAGGSLRITSAVGRGTSLELEVPCA